MNASKFEPSFECAKELDDHDMLFSFRERFYFPVINDELQIYLCGNSLGLQPKSTKYLFEKELRDWAKWGVEGHFNAENPWFYYHKQFSEPLSKLIGCLPVEVVAMNSLTVNLHLLMISFYKPTTKRYKIIMEAGAFPSDQYAVETQVKMHGLDPDATIIELKPRDGEYILRQEDILSAIEQHGDELACVMMGAVNYYTGQLYPLEAITKAAHKAGAICGFDLAHATGNVPLHLHEWEVDFACFCTYKYLNSGPGGVGGIYVHEKHGGNPEIQRLAGWWGNEEDERFKMEKGFVPSKGAASWQMSNAPVFNMIGLKASLDIFDKTNMQQLRAKSVLLTQYLEYLLRQLKNVDFEIITPVNPEERGAQLSLLFKKDGKAIFDKLAAHQIIVDWREPNVIRVAPTPLYNSFTDIYKFYEVINNFV